MSTKDSESSDGPSWAVYVIAGLAWQGLKSLAAKPQVVSGRRSSAVSAQVAKQMPRAVPKFIPQSQTTQSNENKIDYGFVIPSSDHMRLRDSLGADQRTVNFDWALGEVKNQETEGACTAFAMSSAVEMILKSRFQIEARVDAQRFWSSYKTPTMKGAMDAASKEQAALYATVSSASKLHPFDAGTVLQVRIDPKDFEVISLAEIAFALSEKKPIILSSTISQEVYSKEAKRSGYIYSRRISSTEGHAWLMSGVSRGLKMQGDVWFHMRNSWGANWGRGGNAYLNALHCVENACGFIAIKNISLRELQPTPLMIAASLVEPKSMDSATNANVSSNGEVEK